MRWLDGHTGHHSRVDIHPLQIARHSHGQPPLLTVGAGQRRSLLGGADATATKNRALPYKLKHRVGLLSSVLFHKSLAALKEPMPLFLPLTTQSPHT